MAVTLYSTSGSVDSNIFAFTSETTNFEALYCADMNPDTYWLPTSTADQTIDFDFGASIDVDSIYLYLKNYPEVTTMGMQKWYSDNAISWTQDAGVPVISDLTTPHRIVDLTTSGTHRFWRLVFNTITGSAPQFGMIAFCEKHSLSLTSTFPQGDAIVYKNKQFVAGGGRKIKFISNKSPVKVLDRNYRHVSESDIILLRAAYNNSYGSAIPLILQEGTLDSDLELVRFLNDTLNETQTDYQLYDVNIRYETLPAIGYGDLY